MTLQPFRAGAPVAFAAGPIVFGLGARHGAAERLLELGVTRALIVTDPFLRSLGGPDELQAAMARAGLPADVFDGVAIEPSAGSITTAVEVARDGRYDGVVGFGGGSSMDTAKLAALLVANPGSLLDFVAAPIGRGLPPARPLAPLLMIPTTAGTGSERSAAAIVDFPERGLKGAVFHPRLVPAVALIDPELLQSLPAAVAASAGLDVAIHAAEALTARPADEQTGVARAGYRGRNPFADVWSAHALELAGRYLPRAVADGDDLEARAAMLFAATVVGLGGAGVHLPHACSYPVSSTRHDWVADGYPGAPRLIPHGYALGAIAPAAFELLAPACPAESDRAARLLGGTSLPEAIVELKRAIGAPASLRDLGYTAEDVPTLVRGAAQQQRILAFASRPIDDHDLERVFRTSLRGP